jgi:two-component system chemotaxis response regulator CheY
MARRAFRVLVADDSCEIRELLLEALRSIGCAVSCARDGLEALATLEAERYDLLITDYHMPRLDGLLLLRRLRASTRPLPAILITGQASPEIIEEATREGVAYVIPKPFTVALVLSLVESIRDQRVCR